MDSVLSVVMPPNSHFLGVFHKLIPETLIHQRKQFLLHYPILYRFDN